VTDLRGAALIDVVAATAVVVIMTAIAVPVVGGSMERERTLVGAQFLAGQLQRARLAALRRAASVAVRIDIVDDRTGLRLYVDGNGNGVLQKDIDKGVDLPLSPVHWIDEHARGVSLRINQEILDAGGSGTLATGDDPLRIGNSALLTFSPLGSATSGTLYVAAQHGPQMAIRVFGATGRVRVLIFDAQTRQWQP
jgi:type II secretory pathway pseudopilin PulG